MIRTWIGSDLTTYQTSRPWPGRRGCARPRWGCSWQRRGWRSKPRWWRRGARCWCLVGNCNPSEGGRCQGNWRSLKITSTAVDALNVQVQPFTGKHPCIRHKITYFLLHEKKMDPSIGEIFIMLSAVAHVKERLSSCWKVAVSLILKNCTIFV